MLFIVRLTQQYDVKLGYMQLTYWGRNYLTKQVRIMKQTAFSREKNRVYTTFKIFGTYIC